MVQQWKEHGQPILRIAFLQITYSHEFSSYLRINHIRHAFDRGQRGTYFIIKECDVDDLQKETFETCVIYCSICVERTGNGNYRFGSRCSNAGEMLVWRREIASDCGKFHFTCNILSNIYVELLFPRSMTRLQRKEITCLVEDVYKISL